MMFMTAGYFKYFQTFHRPTLQGHIIIIIISIIIYSF